ncbi:hypothetical protein ABH930_001444 [Kitasatospora sp. GAS204A]|uniref:hypothetical protein n=1 Tax=unclassified Kitasatospora TaxID=2633591 RepID=UPI002476BAB5|nr:hypothetical protein [Kitasatospora sp. GAS204B]MDH6118444.1 hypothetical protein [Kitasatospora sp. GAS204B]
MTATQAPSSVPLPVEPSELPLPRSMADAVLRGLLSGTAFAVDRTSAASATGEPSRPSGRYGLSGSSGSTEPSESGEPAEAEPLARVADRERTAPAHCRFGMQYLD